MNWSLEPQQLRCPECDAVLCDQTPLIRESSATDTADVTEAGGMPSVDLDQCLICGDKDLFVRKDFPQRLGVGIVVIGFAASIVAWQLRWIITTYAILFVTALIDLFLYYFITGTVLECYRCHAQYRFLPGMEGYEAFDLETHEKHRQQQIRMKEISSLTTPPSDASSSE
ncbi:MAG: hypothetical protein R3C28_28180 [Pirellulaceae bacterium]